MDGSLAAAREPFAFPSIHSLSIKLLSFHPYRFSSMAPPLHYEMSFKDYLNGLQTILQLPQDHSILIQLQN